MDNNILDVKYSKETFNFLMQILNYVFEREKNAASKDSIFNLMNKIKASHNWEIADTISVVLTLDAVDFSIINYCYESLLYDSMEAKMGKYGCGDYFTIYYEEDKLRRDNK